MHRVAHFRIGAIEKNIHRPRLSQRSHATINKPRSFQRSTGTVHVFAAEQNIYIARIAHRGGIDDLDTYWRVLIEGLVPRTIASIERCLHDRPDPRIAAAAVVRLTLRPPAP